ncbi:hypothetical protein PTMSG1_05430 [Pyrenophora teres f. maculata]|nr:hypothetical protein PTMSG1_05430 [Pyrenophora teres f. maculata]
MTTLQPTSTFPYQPFTPSPTTSYPYFVRPEPVDAQQQPFQPFHMAPQTTTLNAGASAIFGKLRTRSALHIKLLGEDIERLRDFNPGFESEEKESVLRDVGILLQLRSQTAESALAVTKGPEDKLSKVKNKELRKLVERMRAKKSQSKDYVNVVEDKWREFETRKTAVGEEGVRYHKDLGLLMQFSAEQRCAVVEKLLGLIQMGVIKEDGGEVLMGRKSFEFYYLKEEKGKWIVAAQEDVAGGERQVEAVGGKVVVAEEVVGVGDKKRKAEGEGFGSKKRKTENGLEVKSVYRAQKKIKKEDVGEKRREWVPKEYVPKANEWKCGKCGRYSLGDWCTKTERGRAVCIGRREGS